MKRPRNGKEVAEKEQHKKARVVQTTYIGRLKDWKRDGITQINISGDCEDVCVISTFKEGKREGLTYSFYKQTGKLYSRWISSHIQMTLLFWIVLMAPGGKGNLHSAAPVGRERNMTKTTT